MYINSCLWTNTTRKTVTPLRNTPPLRSTALLFLSPEQFSYKRICHTTFSALCAISLVINPISCTQNKKRWPVVYWGILNQPGICPTGCGSVYMYLTKSKSNSNHKWLAMNMSISKTIIDKACAWRIRSTYNRQFELINPMDLYTSSGLPDW